MFRGESHIHIPTESVIVILAIGGEKKEKEKGRSYRISKLMNCHLV